MSDVRRALLQDVVAVFRQTHGDIPFTLQLVTEVEGPRNCEVHGVCDFERSPPEISIRADLSETELIDTLCHELAHVACGVNSAHDEVWEAARDELSIRFWASRFPSCDG